MPVPVPVKVPRTEDSVLLYPDSEQARSGNKEQTNEGDFKGLTITARRSKEDTKLPLQDGPDEHAGDTDTINKSDGESGEAGRMSTELVVKDLPFSTKTGKEKTITVVRITVKILAALVCLYFFILSLDLMSKSLRLIGGKSANELFRNKVAENPIAGVMIGLLATVLVQSSSTSTSILVSMVSADLLTVPTAIPMVMGANIGTSVTNTLVAFSQLQSNDQFERAFAGATVHDLFNGLTTLVLLTLEMVTGYLYELTNLIVRHIQTGGASATKYDYLQRITKPIIDCIVVLDSKVAECWLIPNDKCLPSAISLISRKAKPGELCPSHIFISTTLKDGQVGGILFGICLVVICVSLISLVKLLSSLLKGHISVVLKKTVNSGIPHCSWLTGYIAILVGTLMTFLVQSSSVFTSTLTPLVGLGVISVELMYPLTLGANIGTTTTALISAFAVNPAKFKASLQIALCHLCFNLSGTLIFYPLPFMRWPVMLAKKLGSTSARYRWFAIVYVLGSFVILPLILLGLSIAGTYYALALVIPLVLLIVFVALVNILQAHCPQLLCRCLRTWDCLPLPLRSLEPYNNVLVRIKCCRALQSKSSHGSRIAKHDSEFTVQVPTRFAQTPKASTISLNSFPMEAATGGDGSNRPSLKKSLDTQPKGTVSTPSKIARVENQGKKS